MKTLTDPTQRERLQLAGLAEVARRDVSAFAEFVMRDEAGRPWAPQPCHRQWLAPPRGACEYLHRHADRSSHTSSYLTVALPPLLTSSSDVLSSGGIIPAAQAVY
jgi:hypothetical protein